MNATIASNNKFNTDKNTNSAAQVVAKEQMSSPLPVIKPEIFLNDHSLVAVYCFVKNFIG